jgi:MGT family glycosyltransferase
VKALFVNVSSVGHVVPTLGLVEALVRRGVAAVYLEIEQHREELEACGARVRPLALPAQGYDGPQGAQLPTLPAVLAHCAIDWTGTVAEIIREEKPDILVHDSLCLWGRLAADMTGVPRVASIASAAISRRMLTSDPVVAAWRAAAGDPAAFEEHFARSWDRISARYGCPAQDMVASTLNTAPCNIVHLSRSLQPHEGDFGPDYLFCGAGEPTRHLQHSFDWASLSDRRVVLMSFGTAHDPGREFYVNVARAMCHVDATLVVIDSPSMHPNAIEWPEGTVVCANGSAPQIKLLERADLFISHVAGGAVREAAWMATPILGLPQTFEQDLFCHHLSARGFALRLSDRPGVEEIASRINDMLTNKTLRARAQALSDLQRSAPPADGLAAEAIIGQMTACA